MLKKGQRSTFVEATYPSKVARTGVLHGDAANANVSPAKYAWTPDKSQEQVIRAIFGRSRQLQKVIFAIF